MEKLQNINLSEILISNLMLLKLELRKIAKPTDDFTKTDGLIELFNSFGFMATAIDYDGELIFKYILIKKNQIFSEDIFLNFQTFNDDGEIEFKPLTLSYGHYNNLNIK